MPVGAPPYPPTPAFSPAMLVVCVAALLVPHDFGSVYSVGKSALLLLGLVWLVPSVRPRLANPAILLFGILVWLWPPVSALWHSGRLGFHARDGFTFLTAWLVIGLALCLQATQTEQTRAAVRGGITLSAVVTAVWMLLVFLTQGTTLAAPDTWGAAGPWGNRNSAAQFLVLALALGGAPRPRPWFTLLTAVALLASGSRAACAAGLLWWLWQPWWRHDPRRLLAALFILTTATGAWLWHSGETRHSVSYLTAPDRYVAERLAQPAVISDRDAAFRGKSDSALSRLILWRHSLQLATRKPWFGFGPGQFRVAYPTQVRAPDPNLNDTFRPFHAHQALLEAAALFGLPWLVLALATGAMFVAQHRDPSWRLALALQGLLAMVSLNYTNCFLIVLLLVCAPEAVRHGTPAVQHDALPAPTPYWRRTVVTLLLLSAALLTRPAPQQRAARALGLAPTWFAAHQARAAADQGRYQDAWRALCRELYADPYGPTPRHNLATLWEHWAQRDAAVPPACAAALYRDNARRFPFYRASHTDAVRLGDADTAGQNPFDNAAWESWLSTQPAPDPRQNPWPSPP